ncbi:conserved hypothetical protein [Neospora caninum Liverpool]|uniref:Cyclin N-terminal domain-containing protein n=1 Tax=Neospora caninum (strain Liverpool) TaxID=572307 RepID=F0VNB9_NEOCL|nr:conserved hypothetical protein [Neospora caninum Liverpool]CBZ55215.1 conserved hypothetical protein [Neospora caninum Liverpool]CEL69942.1 TPA: hypothetical protein BN1204_056390 [Neospora caninum Liverpool]|eukprot:XP_003885243.1 conserved hypothetical protein [Neospora caninum Liverpool]
MGKKDEKIFGPFLPSQGDEGNAPDSAIPSPQTPAVSYPDSSSKDVWDALRFHLSLLFQQAAFDLNLPVHAVTAAVSAFRRVFPKYFSRDELENRPHCVTRCMAACLFFAGKASDTNLKLREAVNCIAFLNWSLKNKRLDGRVAALGSAEAEDKKRTRSETEGAAEQAEKDEGPPERRRRISAGVGNEREAEDTSGERKEEGEKQAGAGGDESGGKHEDEKRDDKQAPLSRLRGPQSLPNFLKGYAPMGIRDYWKVRQECLLEEQRLCQALGFSLELPLLHDAVLEAQLLLLFSHKETHLMWAIVNDISATPLVDQFSVPVLIAAAAICTKKLVRLFDDEQELALLSRGDERTDENQEGHPVGEAASSAGECGKTVARRATGETEENGHIRSDDGAQGKESERQAAALSSCSDTRDVLQRLSPLLEGSPEFWGLLEARNAFGRGKIGFGPLDRSRGSPPDALRVRSSEADETSDTEDKDKCAEERRRQRRQLYVHLAEVCTRLFAFYGLVVKYRQGSDSRADLVRSQADGEEAVSAAKSSSETPTA